MDTFRGCVFIDTAGILKNLNGKKYYDWDNKIIFNLTTELIDTLVYFIDFNINNGRDVSLSLTSKDVLFNLQLSDQIVKIQFTSNNTTIENNLTLASLYGFSSMLKAAKVKIYGWA